MKINSTIAMLIVSINLVGCEKPQKKLIGTWTPDVSETKSYNKERLSKNPFGEFALTLIAKTLKLEFSETELTIIMGDSEKTTKYKFLSFADNNMVIQNDENGKEMTFKFLANDKLVFSKKSKDEDQLDIIMLKNIGEKQQQLENAKEIYTHLIQANIDSSTTDTKKWGFPFDAGYKSTSEYKKMLTDESYIGTKLLQKLDFQSFLIGNISDDDSPNTIILMSRPDNSSCKVVILKNGQGAVLKNEESYGEKPPREPAFLKE